MKNEKIGQLKNALENEIDKQTDKLLNDTNFEDGYDTLNKLNTCLNALSSISTIEAQEKSKLAYDTIISGINGIDMSKVDIGKFETLFNAMNKNI